MFDRLRAGLWHKDADALLEEKPSHLHWLDKDSSPVQHSQSTGWPRGGGPVPSSPSQGPERGVTGGKPQGGYHTVQNVDSMKKREDDFPLSTVEDS